MEHRCVICKRDLPKEYEDVVCHRTDCQITLKHQLVLADRINQYIDFFTSHSQPTSEATYKEYFELAGLESNYQRFTAEKPMSRRQYFHLNIGWAHHGWPDEFGRPFGE